MASTSLSLRERFTLDVTDAVWARLKGHKYWPGRICRPTEHLLKIKKPDCCCIYFFGSHNYGWVKSTQVLPFWLYRNRFEENYNTPDFVLALEEIKKYCAEIYNHPDYDPDEERDNVVQTISPLPRSKRKRSEKKTPEYVPNDGNHKDDAETETPYRSKSRMKGTEGKARSKSRIRGGRGIDISLLDLNHCSSPVNMELDYMAPGQLELDPPKARLGFIGLGNMGTALVKRFIQTNHTFNIYNRTVEKAEQLKKELDENYPDKIVVCETVVDLFYNSDIIFCCISNEKAVKNVLHTLNSKKGKKNHLKDKCYVEMTTVGNEMSVVSSRLLKKFGGTYLEAQIQGNCPDVVDNGLVLLCAGDRALLDQCESCFASVCRAKVYYADVGRACQMNAVLQTIRFSSLFAMTESLALAQAVGIYLVDVQDILEKSEICSDYLKHKLAGWIEGDLTQDDYLKLAEQDMQLMVEMGDMYNFPQHIASTINVLVLYTIDNQIRNSGSTKLVDDSTLQS